ncbi:hypothetical protein ELQ92_14890 [Labedella populi]|uniref:Histidine kinase/HSP90-like ATPase domain-containing protein n=1 Tax=Labedella populi TaxID=2498850 RepID=A0A3S4AF11_9MICO|nr:hypothetical protein [Labedella populi]RWZ58307.1 hypothetical protein ELQ92_14890 [Labedella populi]
MFGLMERGGAEEVVGTGIDLSTCRRIVEAHGSRSGIEDSSLGGASVWFVIADTAADPAASPVTSPPERISGP